MNKRSANSPVWGTLTGIRPSKIVEKIMESGDSKISAANKLIQKFHVSPDRAKLCADIAQSSLHLKSSLEPHDISLYIGIPFCPSRCIYCSFVSNSVEKSFNLIEPYVNLLLSEISETAKLVKKLGLNIISVYIGGGTPTILSAQQLETIMQALSAEFDLSNLREYTLEAGRPDTISTDKLSIIKQMGATRICINPQTMSDDVLTAIGRKHTRANIIEATQLAKNTDLALNMDIIAGLPTDTPDGFRETLNAVLDLKPENITIHTLSQKKGSRLSLEDISIPGADDVEKMLNNASETLTSYNYNPYYLYRLKFTSGGFENIGWSLPRFDGLYNKLMMEDIGTVIGMGAGSVSKLVLPNGRIERIFNTKFPREYILQSSKIDDKIEKIKTYISGSTASPRT